MPTIQSLMEDLRAGGSAKTQAIYVRHGMPAASSGSVLPISRSSPGPSKGSSISPSNSTKPATCDSLDLNEIEELLKAIEREIAAAPNRVKSTMNSFVISVGTYVSPLLETAKAYARQIGPVSVDVGDTACKVPSALESIAKVEALGKVGQKRRTIRC